MLITASAVFYQQGVITKQTTGVKNVIPGEDEDSGDPQLLTQ